MGLAASQARLLSLTARLSDLELRAQQISNSKIRLSMEGTEASEEYLRALDKERLTIKTGMNADGSLAEQDLSYYNLTGVDSPLMTQYGLSDRNGRLLVTKKEADAFKNSPNGDEFCRLMGAPTTTTHSNNVVTISQAEYDAAQKAYDDSRKVLNDYGSNNNNGSPHIKGYTKDGEWQYGTQTQASAPVTYSDPEVFSSLSSNNYSITNVAYYSASNYSQQAKFSADGSSSADTVVSFYKNSVDDSTGSSVGPAIDQITGFAATSLKSVLQKKLGSSFANVSGQIDAAVLTARENTKNYFKTQFVNRSVYDIKDPYNDVVIGAVQGTNQIWDDFDTIHEYYVDMSQVTKTFLSYFDSAYASASGAPDPTITNQIGNGKTIRPATSSVIFKAETKQDVNYNSTANPDKIVYLTPVAGETEASVKATYEPLLKDFVTKRDYFLSFTITNVEKSKNTDYYMNIYNKMKQDGYFNFTEEEEKSTINDPAWTQNQMLESNLVLCKVVKNDKGKMVWEDAVWQNNREINEKEDKRFIAQAEAKYNSTLADIQSKDKRFDLELKNIDTEHQAIQATIDGVKKVIDKNIDRNFKMFEA